MGLASNDPDIRWQQRFANYCKGLELTGNTLRDLLRSQGNDILIGSRDTLREAFRLELIEEGESWMLMIQDRNLTSHTYNRSTADDIAANINSRYLACFQQLRERMHQLQNSNL